MTEQQFSNAVRWLLICFLIYLIGWIFIQAVK
jgi:hypothetical protein